MTLSSPRSALARTVAIMAAFTLAACTADPPPTVDSALDGLVAGLPLPAYRVSSQRDITTAEELLTDECDVQHSFWVNMVYQRQPSSAGLHEALRNSLEDELRNCLEDAGYQTDPQAIGVALAIQAAHVVYVTEFAVDCLAQTGAS